jgi:WD40 repeat protein
MPSGREVITMMDGASHYKVLAFAPDGAVLATAGFDGIIRLWDIASGQVVSRIEAHDRGVHALAFSPDGSMLASGGGGFVKVWDVATGRVRTTPVVGQPVTPSPR